MPHDPERAPSGALPDECPPRRARRPFYRHLPHVREPGYAQAVTFRLADSLPLPAVTRLKADTTNDTAALRSRIAVLLDQGYSSCALRDRRIAGLVEEALLHGDGSRYTLHAWVIMPSHVHVLVTPYDGVALGTIVRVWKSYTARRANILLGRSGRLWQPDYFDRYIRNERHFQAAITYIDENPVKAGLVRFAEDWAFGSASRKRA